jgi:hypothetical protein
MPLAMAVYGPPLMVARFTLKMIGTEPVLVFQLIVTLPVPTLADGSAGIDAAVRVTITLNEQFGELLPLASVAVQVTMFVPCVNVEPLGGAQLLVTPGQLSVAFGE